MATKNGCFVAFQLSIAMFSRPMTSFVTASSSRYSFSPASATNAYKRRENKTKITPWHLGRLRWGGVGGVYSIPLLIKHQTHPSFRSVSARTFRGVVEIFRQAIVVVVVKSVRVRMIASRRGIRCGHRTVVVRPRSAAGVFGAPAARLIKVLRQARMKYLP